MIVPNDMTARGLRPARELGQLRPHGVRLRYMAGCRCLKCRMANANYETARARARADGDWNGIVDAAPAREHIKRLSRQGVGYKLVAAAASLPSSIVFGIRTGRRTRARARTVKKILAVTPACRGDAALVSAKETWRLIGLLLAEGYTKGQLARLLGSQSPRLQLNKRRVTARTAAKVQRLYRRLTT